MSDSKSKGREETQISNIDPALIEQGDTRNVVDKYRFWKHESIVADLDKRRHPYHVAVENFQHDFNIGAVVRNANAFLASGVHIVGKRRWNRRGAMSTDRYQHIYHKESVAELSRWAADENLAIIGIDNIESSVPIEQVNLPEKCVLLFGQEGPGLSEAAQQASEVICALTQFGSTRSVNAGVASGIAMYVWLQTHILNSESS